MENSCHLSHDKLLSFTLVRTANYRRSRHNLSVSLVRLWLVLFSKQGCSCNFGNVFSIHVNNAFYEETNTIIIHSERHTAWKTLWGNWPYGREKTQQYISNIFVTEWFKESGNKIKTRIQVFWDIILWRLVNSYQCSRVASHPRVHRPLKMETASPLKCQQLFTNRHDITSQKMSIFISTAVRMSDLAL